MFRPRSSRIMLSPMRVSSSGVSSELADEPKSGRRSSSCAPAATLAAIARIAVMKRFTAVVAGLGPDFRTRILGQVPIRHGMRFALLVLDAPLAGPAGRSALAFARAARAAGHELALAFFHGEG